MHLPWGKQCSRIGCVVHPLDRVLGDRLQRNVPLARFTAARLGGKADWLYRARTNESELLAVVAAAWESGLKVRVLGKGANVLVAPDGIRGLVVIQELQEIASEKCEGGDWLIRASAGTHLGNLARYAQRLGIAGLEWLATVPGTVGGAVVNNAGAHGADIAGHFVNAEVLFREAGRRKLCLAEMAYGYRTSSLKAATDRDFLILLAQLRLPQGDRAAIDARTRELLRTRREKQPHGASLGSIFKNPIGDYAGRIIETAGLKGVRMGAMEVSQKHANFFINHGDGNPVDYLKLIHHVQRCVRDRVGIDLELEIELIGAW